MAVNRHTEAGFFFTSIAVLSLLLVGLAVQSASILLNGCANSQARTLTTRRADQIAQAAAAEATAVLQSMINDLTVVPACASQSTLDWFRAVRPPVIRTRHPVLPTNTLIDCTDAQTIANDDGYRLEEVRATCLSGPEEEAFSCGNIQINVTVAAVAGPIKLRRRLSERRRYYTVRQVSDDWLSARIYSCQIIPVPSRRAYESL